LAIPAQGSNCGWPSERARWLEQHLGANLSGGDFALRNHRRLVAVAIDQRL
jgi:hypothetical protein